MVGCLYSFLVYTQGSSKLEKAEVLQMTVDHLKMLHATGGAGRDAFLTGRCPCHQELGIGPCKHSWEKEDEALLGGGAKHHTVHHSLL